MNKKSKFQAKVEQSTRKRREEQRANRRRAAWNRVGAKFGISKRLLDLAKSAGMNPYVLLRDPATTRAQAVDYIEFGTCPGAIDEADWADYAIGREIAEAESTRSRLTAMVQHNREVRT